MATIVPWQPRVASRIDEHWSGMDHNKLQHLTDIAEEQVAYAQLSGHTTV